MSSPGASEFIWPAARAVVERHAPNTPCTPPVRSTYTSRVRAGEEVGSRSCTLTQVRALAATIHHGLAGGERGDKAKAWHEKLRGHDHAFEPTRYTSSYASASRPPGAHVLTSKQQRQQRGAGMRTAAGAAPSRPGEAMPPALEAWAESEGREASEADANADAEAAAEAEAEAEADGAEADGRPLPAPPAAIAFAWQHPTQLLENIGTGQCSWGPKQQRCLEHYLRQVEGVGGGPGSSTPSVRGYSTPASPMAVAPAPVMRARPSNTCRCTCRPASAPAPSAVTTHAELVYRNVYGNPTASTTRPSTASGARARRACREPPSRPASASASASASCGSAHANAARRPPPPPPPPEASWVTRLAPRGAQEERRRRLFGTLRQKAEDETALSKAWVVAASVAGTPEENFAVQVSRDYPHHPTCHAILTVLLAHTVLLAVLTRRACTRRSRP